MKYFLHIAYNGSKYRGWQRQTKNIRTVQAALEDTLTKMIGSPMICNGCGRTDACVHASQYFLHIELNRDWEWQYDPIFRLNKMLPKDIVVFDVIKMEEATHARFGAQSRTYDYFIHSHKDPFIETLSSYYDLKNLDLNKMHEACQLFVKYKDFRSVCKSPDKHNHTLCEVKTAQLFVDPDKNRLRFNITSNRFLRGMIRLIVGRLLEVGKGNVSFDELEEFIALKEPSSFHRQAYPQGLYLSKVEYPYLTLPTRSDFALMLEYKLNGDWVKLS